MILRKILEELTFLGGILFYLLFSVYFLFTKQYTLFLILLFGLLAIYLITLIIRTFYFKHRPKKIKYKSFLEKIDASSFPSIHATRATFLFVFLTIQLINKPFLILVSLTLTILVFYSRIFLKKHDFIDVFGGILLGIFISLIHFLNIK